MKAKTKPLKTVPPTAKRLFDFLKLAPAAFTFSTALLLASVALIGLRGFHWGLDFTGGTLVEIQLSQASPLTPLRAALEAAGFQRAIIQHAGSSYDVMIRLAPREKEVADHAMSTRLMALVQQSIDPHAMLKRIEFVGPTVGTELAQAGGLAILAALLSILIYIGLRFEWRLAMGGVLALAHDVVLTLGMLSLLQVDVDLTLIAALLSVVGYSLNDTIVVFDRIRENFRQQQQADTRTLINLSLTQTLSRTLITSATTLMVVLALLVFGGPLLYGFSLVLLVGIVVGTFSSIYVASALALKLGLNRDHLLPKPILIEDI